MALTDHGIYQRWSDNVARDAILTINTGTDPGDSQYGPDALVDDNPAKLAKIDSTTGAWLIDSGTPTDVQLAGLIHHDFDAGVSVVLQASNDLSDFTSSPITPPFEAVITIPAWLGSGTRLWPVNPWVDLTQVEGYDATGWRYRRLLVTGNSQNLRLGQLWLGGTIRRFDPDIRWGVQRGFRKRLMENQTSHGVVSAVSRGVTQWRQSGEILADADATEADLTDLAADLQAHWFDVDGRALPWLIVPDGAVNKCYFVRFANADHGFQWQAPGARSFSYEVEELSRGLRPGI